MKWSIQNGWLVCDSDRSMRRWRLEGVVSYRWRLEGVVSYRRGRRDLCDVYIETERNMINLGFPTEDEAAAFMAALDAALLGPGPGAVLQAAMAMADSQ